jgi:hypothetical protein
MFTADDPTLALLMRFVVSTDPAAAGNEEFLQRQLKAINRHLAQYPANQQGNQVMRWIEEHAERYRADWQQRTVAARSTYLRCADCPLADLGATEHCEIHEQWLYLLRRYTSGEIDSREYVEHALAVLQEYKDALKLRVSAIGGAAKKPKQEKRKKKKKHKKSNKAG